MTSDERRNVAERLRNNKTTSVDCNSCKIISRALYGYDSAICNRCEQVARDGYVVPNSCEGEGFGRLLADLIDPPRKGREPCAHGDVCRAYMRERGVILRDTCPECEHYEPMGGTDAW